MKVRRPIHVHWIRNTHEKLWTEDLYKLFKKNISFGTGINTDDQNIQGFMIEIADSGLAGAQIIIPHNLGYIPKFYDVKYMSAATQVYDQGTAWTVNNIYLASSIAHIKLRIFVH